jgi:hypothetical protein
MSVSAMTYNTAEEGETVHYDGGGSITKAKHGSAGNHVF